MLTYPNSTVGQLLFRNPSDLCFTRIVTDLQAAIEAAIAAPRKSTWDHDDVVLVDYEGTRITLGYTTDVPGRHWAACLTIAVGAGPAHDPGLMPERQARFARVIADRISRHFPPDETRWHELPAVMTAELVDALINAVADREETLEATPHPDPFPPIDDDLVSAADARTRDAMAGRSRDEQTGPDPVRQTRSAPGRARSRKSRPRPVLETNWLRPGVPANDMPDVPAAATEEATRIRAALYEEAAQATSKGDSAQIRLAAHVMNATIMIMSLPIGASVMTYSLLRGGNLRSSARVMALVGIAIGVSQMMFGVPMPGMLF